MCLSVHISRQLFAREQQITTASSAEKDELTTKHALNLSLALQQQAEVLRGQLRDDHAATIKKVEEDLQDQMNHQVRQLSSSCLCLS